MNMWSLTAEVFSFILLAILFIHHYVFDRGPLTRPRMVYLHCIILSVISVGVDALSLVALLHPGMMPIWAETMINEGYYLVCIAMCSMLTFCVLQGALAHVYDPRPLKIAETTLIGITAFFVLLIFFNQVSGVLFYMDESGTYQRGPIYFSGYVLMGAMVGITTAYLIRYKDIVETRIVRMIAVIIPLVVALVVVQLMLPNLFLNGTMAALSCLIISLNSQSEQKGRDTLTMAYNRNMLNSELELRIRGRQHIQIIQVSLEDFAGINRRYGSRVADSLLYETSRYLKAFHPQGRVYRFTGVSFVLLLPGTDKGESELRLEKLQRRFANEWEIGREHCMLRAILVEMEVKGDYTPLQAIEALEYARRKARAEELPVLRCGGYVARELENKKNIAAVMNRALEKGGFEVWYQPVYSIKENGFNTAEALLRLYDENGRFISPAAFIPIAEENGTIEEMSWFVLEEICKFMSGPNHGSIRAVSWNLCSILFEDPRLTEQVLSVLKKYRLSPEVLRMEVTERMLVSNIPEATRQMERLSGAGFRIYLDDFGTGYANFSAVLAQPFSVIKLDRSLVSPITRDSGAALIVKSMLEMFKNLGKIVVVEGVENKAQADMLKTFGAEFIQGYLYSRPMPGEAVCSFLQDYAASTPAAAPLKLSRREDAIG